MKETHIPQSTNFEEKNANFVFIYPNELLQSQLSPLLLWLIPIDEW